MPRICFTVAGLALSATLRHTSNLRMITPFQTQVSACLDVTPTPADLEKSRAELAALAGEGVPVSPTRVECVALHERVCELMPARDCMMMHGSALSCRGRGVIFIAPSGTGKSTHSRLWREAFGGDVSMINDDKPMLELTGQGVFAWGTPWNGKHRLGGTHSAPIEAVAVLTRGERTRVMPLTEGEAYTALLNQIYRPATPEGMKKTFELIDRLCESVRLYSLEATMSADAAIISRRGIFGDI